MTTHNLLSPCLPSTATTRCARELERWLIDHITTTLGLDPELVQPEASLLELGLDSVEAVTLAADLEGWLAMTVSPTIVWEHPTIHSLAVALTTPDEALICEPRRTVANLRPCEGHKFAAFINPPLADLLDQVKLDKRFVRGQGCTLYDHQGRAYIDFIAAYGALPLGHNPAEPWQALQTIHQRSEPNFVQPSYLEAAGDLAARLLSIAPPALQRVTFANSGTEAVEAAIKMCRMATGRPGVLSTRGGFHGKTLGALSATGNPTYQTDTGAPLPGFDHIPFGDARALKAQLQQRPGYYAAFIVEPIQGEGGIMMPPPGYLKEIRAICDAADVPLVFDEVQTGLGRTGAWFACDHEGVTPDVMILAKALGGGMVPIGAVLSTAEIYSDNFGLKHSSTFAGGGLACRVALATLEQIARDDAALIRQVADNGQFLRDGLQRVADRYPHLVSEVRGRGYLLGLRLAAHRRTWPSNLLGLAAEEGGLVLLLAAYLLNVEGVRVAPTLNGTDVIRIEPPLVATRQQCQTVMDALERALAVFATGDTARVLGGIISGEARPARPGARRRPRPRAVQRPAAGDGRFAFVLHPLTLRSYADFDTTLAALPSEQIEAAARCVHGLASPVVVSEARVISPTGSAAFGEFIMVGHTAAELSAMPHAEATATIREAVELARDRGAELVGLGGFSSIVTQGGLAVRDVDIAVTSGNAYTTAAAYDAVMLALEQRSQPARQTTVAVVGANGAIGRALSLAFAEQVERLILVGNPNRSREQAQKRLLEVTAAACSYVVDHAVATPAASRRLGPLSTQILDKGLRIGPGAPIAAFYELAQSLVDDGNVVQTQDAAEAGQTADVLLTATSDPGQLLDTDDLRPGAIVCEVSRPRNLGPRLRAERPDVRLIDGGVVELPGRPDIGAFGLSRGHAFACMAETMLLALDKHDKHTSLGGALDPAHVQHMRHLAAKHGFRVFVDPPAPTPHKLTS